MEKYEKYYKPSEETMFPFEFKNYETIKALPNSVVINEGTKDEYVFAREIDLGYFPITSVSREDFEAIGFDAKDVTDDEMERLASRMADTYIEYGGYWDMLREYGDDNGLPTIPTDGDEESEDEEDNE